MSIATSSNPIRTPKPRGGARPGAGRPRLHPRVPQIASTVVYAEGPDRWPAVVLSVAQPGNGASPLDLAIISANGLAHAKEVPPLGREGPRGWTWPPSTG
jgi:hypothetical protein